MYSSRKIPAPFHPTPQQMTAPAPIAPEPPLPLQTAEAQQNPHRAISPLPALVLLQFLFGEKNG